MSENQFVVIALYKFAHLEDYHDLREPLLGECEKLGIKGTLLLAKEGINGTVSGARHAVNALVEYINSIGPLKGIEFKESFYDDKPFYRMKVKLKKEIVTMGVDDIDPNKIVGTYVEPEDWNNLISDPDVTLIDTRNQYEVDIGTFEGAISPHTETFREFPEFAKTHLDPAKNKKVAMFCTGGIRCEKSTAYMKAQGFDEVYHLKGGILKYLEEVPESKSKWQGECFVFDNRVSVNHQLEKGEYDLCHGCRLPITEADKQSEFYEAGVSCHQCYHTLTDVQRARFRERQKQILLAKERNETHIGASLQARKKHSSNGSMIQWHMYDVSYQCNEYVIFVC